MRHPAGTHGRDRAERPDYRRHGHDPRHGRHGYRAFRTHALGLWIENRASKPVAITRYDRSCGCTTLGYDAQPITPGDAQQVSLTFDARGEWGWQLKTLDIAFAGGRKPLRLFIEAEVE